MNTSNFNSNLADANQILEVCQSLWDCVPKPRVARNELPWCNGSARQNPNGVSALVNVHRGSQPRWGCCFARLSPSVPRSSPILRSSGPPRVKPDLEATAEGGQPWALLRNPVGIQGKGT